MSTPDPNCLECAGTGERPGFGVFPGLTHPCSCRERYDVEQQPIASNYVSVSRGGLDRYVDVNVTVTVPDPPSAEAFAKDVYETVLGTVSRSSGIPRDLIEGKEPGGLNPWVDGPRTIEESTRRVKAADVRPGDVLENGYRVAGVHMSASVVVLVAETSRDFKPTDLVTLSKRGDYGQ